jgi:hypothetical protein
MTTASWIDHARQLFADAYGSAAVSGPLRVTIRNADGQGLTFRLPAMVGGDSATPCAAPLSTTPAKETEQFSPMESAVLEVLAAGNVLTGPQIAVLAGYPYETGLKTCLAALRRRGLIINQAPGYSLARPCTTKGPSAP